MSGAELRAVAGNDRIYISSGGRIPQFVVAEDCNDISFPFGTQFPVKHPGQQGRTGHIAADKKNAVGIRNGGQKLRDLLLNLRFSFRRRFFAQVELILQMEVAHVIKGIAVVGLCQVVDEKTVTARRDNLLNIRCFRCRDFFRLLAKDRRLDGVDSSFEIFGVAPPARLEPVRSPERFGQTVIVLRRELQNRISKLVIICFVGEKVKDLRVLFDQPHADVRA